MAAVASAERKWTEAGIPLTTRLLGWVVSASTLVNCCRKWSARPSGGEGRVGSNAEIAAAGALSFAREDVSMSRAQGTVS
jgi:hypothetical protein